MPDVTLTFALWHAIIHVFINESDAEAEGNAGMSIMQRAARRRARIRRAALSGAVLAVAVCLFAGCRGIPDGFVGGETLTPEKLREISAAVFTDPVEPDTQPPVADPVLAAYAGRVYWLEGGTSCAHRPELLSYQPLGGCPQRQSGRCRGGWQDDALRCLPETPDGCRK